MEVKESHPDLKERMERNRAEALKKLREKRALVEEFSSSPSIDPSTQQSKPKKPKTGEELLREEELRTIVNEGHFMRVQGSKVIDTGGGFLLDEEDLRAEEEAAKIITEEPAPIIPIDMPLCELCQKPFSTSFLFNTYDYNVCDVCRDPDEIHSFITRTDAKTEFLLKDEDLDKREPILKFILKPNPHNPRWGDMKLYLRPQIIERAIEVYGSLEQIEERRETRQENRVKSKIKKYNKKMVGLRMSARSSLYTRDLSSHQHEWGPETYNKKNDNYTHSCTICNQSETFEKM